MDSVCKPVCNCLQGIMSYVVVPGTGCVVQAFHIYVEFAHSVGWVTPWEQAGSPNKDFKENIAAVDPSTGTVIQWQSSSALSQMHMAKMGPTLPVNAGIVTRNARV